ncbi:unnamed protein product [Porites evermanni]|uniref:SAP domain-containing protein n=1 Tax=Porites evermanni TaxID=104178 RepID=A0ABN8MPA9_9CNID|nr:unnamed protein product [Porites evermanni]
MADAAVTTVNLKKLKVAELKKELTDRGLPTKGNKSDLLARLEKCLSEQGVVVSQDENEEITDDHDVEDELDNDADDLDDVDDGEDVSEHLVTEDSEEEAKENKATKVSCFKKKNYFYFFVFSFPSKRVPVTPPEKKPGEVKLTDEQKKAQRLARFGQSSPGTEADKKQARAQRFGLSSPTSNGSKISSPIVSPKGMDVEKLKQRAERFGAISPVVTKLEEKDKLLKRKQRFGVTVSASPSTDADAKKKKRAERFGL